MNKTATTLLIVLATVSCGGEDPGPELTWGEYAQRYSEVYCGAAYTCWSRATGYSYEQEEVDECATHSVYHLCGLDDTCGEEIEDADGADAAMGTCEAATSDMGEKDCDIILFFGLLPEECYPIGDYFWEEEEEEE